MTYKQNYSSRLNQLKPELESLYLGLYTDNPYYNVQETFQSLLDLMDNYFLKRLDVYKDSDINNPNWYTSNTIVGTTLYVDLFSDSLKNFIKYIPYFSELGINFIHFMPLLESRPGENDGGYAVKDYKKIDSKFGSNEDFHNVLKELKKNKIHCCIDFVVNHTAKEHEFAQKALNGEKDYMNMYFMYNNREIPDAFEQIVPEVFPGVAPGNFTYFEEINKWVFTSFYPYQLDLNFQNPFVFEKIIDILLYLANSGVDMIRLDAIPFMWKEVGHSCRNHPVIHILLRMMNLISEIVCPSVTLLGEAIVEPEEIIKYFGEEKPECHIMYNATHMVNLWNSIATRDTRLLQIDSNRLKPLSGGSWINYARCHDDIGWGFNEKALVDIGMSPYEHKQFLINFYKGTFDGSFSIGDLYEFNPVDMDARNCGTMASLLGLEDALNTKDNYKRELALKRINMIHSVLIASEGIPLIYSGDELGFLNDYSYLKDSHKAHDSRWIHRGFFDHTIADRRHMESSNEHILFKSLQHMIKVRKENKIFSPTSKSEIIDTHNHSIYCFTKKYESKTLVALFNFSEDRQFIENICFNRIGIFQEFEDMLTGKSVNFAEQETLLGPYEYIWYIRSN